MAAGPDNAGDLGRGTAATERGLGRESNLCLPFGDKLCGVELSLGDLPIARSQGASVFRIR